MFPANPQKDDIYNDNGSLYKYDNVLLSWIPITTNVLTFDVASPINDGLMSIDDYTKLQNLILPFPSSSLIGDQCSTPFKFGTISLVPADELLGVSGSITAQNIDEFGDKISQDFPFKIHKHTYGYDFKVILDNLTSELLTRSQINLIGNPGEHGIRGDKGPKGIDRVLSGSQGPDGPKGNAPPCQFSVEAEPISVQVRDGVNSALSSASIVVDPNDNTRYSVSFNRQPLGVDNAVAATIKVAATTSNWVLAVASPIVGSAQRVLYLDIEPLMEALYTKYVQEVELLKTGYEEIVEFWIGKMSDLFDEQKAALCCALQYCLSATKNVSTRQHMESVAAAAVGKAKILLNSRTSAESSLISSTTLLGKLSIYPDDGSADVCNNGETFPKLPNYGSSVGIQNVEVQNLRVEPMLHNSLQSAKQIDLKPGKYVAVIKSTEASIDNIYKSDVRIRSLTKNSFSTIQFLDKGSYKSPLGAKSAYEGLAVAFDHDGGLVDIWAPVSIGSKIDGHVDLEISQVIADEIATTSDGSITCLMTYNHVKWYADDWLTGNCCGVVVNLSGQDYIIVRKSLGDDKSCGGGESLETPCMSQFNALNHPALAWPTLDGTTFSDIPERDIAFYSDPDLEAEVLSIINSNFFTASSGPPSGVRDLSRKLSHILFPTL